jgi:hypothetical protein
MSLDVDEAKAKFRENWTKAKRTDWSHSEATRSAAIAAFAKS